MFFRRSIPAKEELNMSFELSELHPFCRNNNRYHCEINEDNYKEVRIIKSPMLAGRVILEKDAQIYGLDYFKCTDLINLLEDYFTNDKLSDRKLISCPISLDILKKPVVLIPVTADNGSVLDYDSTAKLINRFGNHNWIDPKTKCSFNKVYTLPLMSFLINARLNETEKEKPSGPHSTLTFK